MKKRFLLPLIIIFLLMKNADSQTTIVLQPGPEGKDAQLWSIMPNSNYPTSPKFVCAGWTHSGEPGVNRSLIDFDLSMIPENAEITEAKLSFYFVCLEPVYYGHTGNNEAYLQLITESWQEESVTWNTQPSTTETNQLYLPRSADPYQDYTDINVTGLINKLFTEPDSYHGLMLKLINEYPYQCLLFASGDYSDTIEMRPKLEITYTETSNIVVIQPGEEGKDALLWSAYPDYHFGNSPKFNCMAWSHYRETCVTRAVVGFDLSAVPANATITDARLNLYFTCLEPVFSGHTGNNESWLQLITEPWEEDYVTWNNQPATTADNQLYLPASTNPFMDYTNIDVTALVTSQFLEPERYFGFMLKLANETANRSLFFASSDYTDTVEFRPKLEISYVLTSDTIIMQPGEEGKDAQINTISPGNNYGYSPIFKAAAWTHSGVPGTNRALIDFDLSVLPENAIIEDARLNFYFATKEPVFYGHTGENDAWLQLITEPWEEMEVTWDSQPATTTDYQLYLPPSTDPFQDYTDIDVTTLIAKLYSEPETYDGLMFRLVTEDYYRCLLFASSDYTDTIACRPKLQIIYSICEPPVASFTYTGEGMALFFEDHSQAADAYWWNFGDGYYSDLANPWHIYDLPGNYLVCLTTWNECGVDSVCQTISITTQDGAQINDDQNHEIYPDPNNHYLTGTPGQKESADECIFKVYPNPARNQVNVISDLKVQAKLQLFDSKGRSLIDKKIDFSEDGTYTLNTTEFPAGTFCLRVSSGKCEATKVIILTR